MKTKKQDQELMSILKVTEVIRLICETNMGALKLHIRKGENDYFFTLDSVELPKDLNNEIYDLLYKPEIPQVESYLNPLSRNTYNSSIEDMTTIIPGKLDTGIVVNLKKKGGRPVGSKNKK